MSEYSTLIIDNDEEKKRLLTVTLSDSLVSSQRRDRASVFHQDAVLVQNALKEKRLKFFQASPLQFR